MLDEHGTTALQYPWYENDSFDLLGIIEVGEVVAQISSDLSMEELVEWGARLKDSAELGYGTVIQVLFDNIDTGRVSQLQSLYDKSRNPLMTGRDARGHHHYNCYGDKYASSKSHDSNPSSDSYGRLTPYADQSHGKPSSSDHEEIAWYEYRRSVLRPNSPTRYYGPEPSATRGEPREDKVDPDEKVCKKEVFKRKRGRKRENVKEGSEIDGGRKIKASLASIRKNTDQK